MRPNVALVWSLASPTRMRGSVIVLVIDASGVMRFDDWTTGAGGGSGVLTEGCWAGGSVLAHGASRRTDAMIGPRFISTSFDGCRLPVNGLAKLLWVIHSRATGNWQPATVTHQKAPAAESGGGRRGRLPAIGFAMIR